MIEEIWKPVVGYEGLYEVSNLGRVKSLDREIKCAHTVYTRPGRVMGLTVNGQGYHTLNLTRNGECKLVRVHRLVAEAFLPNPSNYPEVDHIDRNTINNVVAINLDGSIDLENTNLRWCTHKENLNNTNTIYYMKNFVDKAACARIGVEKSKELNLPNAPIQVFQYTKEGELVTSYESISTAAKAVGVTFWAIRDVLDKQSYTAKDCLWTTSERNNYKHIPLPNGMSKRIQRLDIEGNVVGEWESRAEAARALGVSTVFIDGRRKKGEFRYVERGGS